MLFANSFSFWQLLTEGISWKRGLNLSVNWSQKQKVNQDLRRNTHKQGWCIFVKYCCQLSLCSLWSGFFREENTEISRRNFFVLLASLEQEKDWRYLCYLPNTVRTMHRLLKILFLYVNLFLLYLNFNTFDLLKSKVLIRGVVCCLNQIFFVQLC